MSSLRPLATIALLAAVGVFLYMKINDSEPKLSPELEEWSTSTLEVGGDDPFAVGAAPLGATTAAPTAAVGDEAPPFAAVTVNPPAARSASEPPAGDLAPAWSAPPVAESESSPVARSADAAVAAPDMPALPEAGGASSAPSADPVVDSAPPANDIVTTPDAPPFDAGAAAATPAGATASPSMYAAAHVAAQGALDRGELAQALTILSEWHGDPSLTPAESQEVNTLLSQLAGSVIYEGPPAHRMLPPHVVKLGETLESIAARYDVPWQLLAKINGVADASALTPGQELKVIEGPFSALIDLSERKMTLKLDRWYAGQFPVDVEPSAVIEEGEWKVDQKNVTPAAGGVYAQPGASTEDRSLLLANLANPTGQAAVIRGPGNADPISSEPRGRVMRLGAADVGDVYDILSIGSRVTIQR